MIVNIDIKLQIKLISLKLIKYIFYFNYFGMSKTIIKTLIILSIEKIRKPGARIRYFMQIHKIRLSEFIIDV